MIETHYGWGWQKDLIYIHIMTYFTLVSRKLEEYKLDLCTQVIFIEDNPIKEKSKCILDLILVVN